MPLFGHKNKNDRHPGRDVNTTDNRHNPNPAGPGQHVDAPGATGNTPGSGFSNNNAAGGASHVPGVGSGATGVGANTAGYGSQPGYNSQPGAHAGGGLQQPGYVNTADQYQNTGGDPAVAPTSHFNDGQHSGGGNRMAGKMEHAVGSLVGSQALKAKGMQKEQEADAFKAQSTEIAEAERLEKEALLRRERAVQHGAHPSNKALGGAQNQGGLGGGAPY